MFRNLERDDQVIAPLQIEALRQVAWSEVTRFDHQLVARYMVAIDPSDVCDASFAEGAQKMAGAASDVEHRSRRHDRQGQRYDALGGHIGGAERDLEELGRVWGLGHGLQFI